jgi:hypothetical protein
LVYWLGFRTANDGIYCMESTPKGVWTGFVCFRPRNGFFAKMAARDLSRRGRVRLARGFDARLRGYHDRRVSVIRAGASWASSDAEMVKCWVRRSGISCRYYYGGRFWLGRRRGSRLMPR